MNKEELQRKLEVLDQQELEIRIEYKKTLEQIRKLEDDEMQCISKYFVRKPIMVVL